MKPGTCIHFTGLGFGRDYKTACCKADVNYVETFDGRRLRLAVRE